MIAFYLEKQKTTPKLCLKQKINNGVVLEDAAKLTTNNFMGNEKRLK